MWASPASQGIHGAHITRSKLPMGEISSSTLQHLICALKQVQLIVQMNTGSPALLSLGSVPPKLTI